MDNSYGPIELLGSSIVAHNYTLGDNERLERMFSVWDKGRHRNKPLGVYYDAEKQDFYLKSQQMIADRGNELSEQLYKKVEEATKQVADAKGLSIVVAKSAVVYGGNDITQDVISKLTKK